MRMPPSCLPIALFILLLHPPGAHADAGDETLAGWIRASDLVVDATISNLSGPDHDELGVANYGATLDVHAVLAGDAPAAGEPPRARIVRFEMGEEDQLPHLREGARVILFLREAEGMPMYETADMWFAVQPHGAWLARRITALAAPATETVKALRYRIMFVESALELTHGGGRWVEELYLPDAGVAALLLFDQELLAREPGEAMEFRERTRLMAFPADAPRNELTGLDGEPSEIEEIEIPADLAAEIAALGRAWKQQQSEQLRIGHTFASRLGWKELPPKGS